VRGNQPSEERPSLSGRKEGKEKLFALGIHFLDLLDHPGKGKVKSKA
jgi:hypothetical protein